MKSTTAAISLSKRRRNMNWSRLAGVLAGFILCAGELSEAAPKVRVQNSEEREKLLRQGGRVLADYESFQLVEVEAGVAAAGGYSLSEREADELKLNGTVIKTRSAAALELRKQRGNFSGRHLHLLQFIGPIKPEWRAAVEALGARVVHYVPQNAYLIQGNAEALARVQSWAATNPVVTWDGDYVADYKLHPGARPRDGFGQLRELGTDTFAIQLLEDAEANSATLALLEPWQRGPVLRDFRVLDFRNLVVRLNPEGLTEVAARPDVISIQPYQAPGKQDERQAQIMAGNLNGTTPTGPGYLAWLAGKGFTAEQFAASGFVVDLTDSGIDNGTILPGHFGLYEEGNLTASSRVAYQRLEGNPNPGSTTAGWDGHGNLNAHILGGFNAYPQGFPHTDMLGFRYGLGICPFVRVGASVVFDPDFFTYPNYADLQSRAYHDGARISANSWGTTNNAYTVDAQAFDALVRDAQPEGSAHGAPGNQEMVIVFAAGNRGAAGFHTVGAPATAKNVITVGASENVRSLSKANGGKSSMGYDGCGYTDAVADAATDLATFSSRGPTSDGRMKPDLVAPGSHVTGGVPQTWASTNVWGEALPEFRASSLCALSGSGTAGSGDNFFPVGQQFYTVSSGTSHAAPAVAGACALLRQYFLNHDLAPPSPAMTKAFLMNSTRFLTGADANDNLWSPGQGMGAINLGLALDGVPRFLRDQVAADIFTASGQTRVFTTRVVASNEPVRITLAWTDAPGNTTGNAFNNDLDLTVVVNGQTYWGNRFSGAHSIPGGSPDGKNNVESIFLPVGIAGDVVVTVMAANINSDGVPNFGSSLDQDFALVVYNATNHLAPVITPAGISVSQEGFFPGNGVVDPGEMVTVSLPLRNTGTAIASNLTVTLLAMNGVTLPDATQSYGDLINDGELISRAFTFVASGDCGGILKPVVQWETATGEVGLMQFELPLGLRSVTTQLFTNSTMIKIPDSGNAAPYPAVIVVSDVAGSVAGVSATIRGFNHGWPDDVDVLLVGPGGHAVLLMSDCGGGNARTGVALTFADDAATGLPDNGAFNSGAYRPTNIDVTTDNFPAPAPAGPYGAALATFAGVNPNGAWSLYVIDDGAMDSGSIMQGWVLSLTTTNLVCPQGELNHADLALATDVSINPVAAGSNFSLTITVTNAGPDAATFISVTNFLPAGVLVDQWQASQGSAVFASSSVQWSVGTLPVGAAAELVLAARALLPGDLTNRCQVGSFTADNFLANNVALESFTAVTGGESGLPVATNLSPVVVVLPDRVIHAGATLVVSNYTTVAESEAGTLRFALPPGAPSGAGIDATTGVITWPTSDADAGTTNEFIVKVSTVGSPVVVASESFLVTVVTRPVIAAISVSGGVVSVSWDTVPGQSYRLEYSTNLTMPDWNAVVPDLVAAGNSLTHTNLIGTNHNQFYRVLVLQ
jgi:uncharacterized repeat protein (TIGR01451 family)